MEGGAGPDREAPPLSFTSSDQGVAGYRVAVFDGKGRRVVNPGLSPSPGLGFRAVASGSSGVEGLMMWAEIRGERPAVGYSPADPGPTEAGPPPHKHPRRLVSVPGPMGIG